MRNKRGERETIEQNKSSGNEKVAESTFENVVNVVSEDLKKGKIKFREALNRIKIEKKKIKKKKEPLRTSCRICSIDFINSYQFCSHMINKHKKIPCRKCEFTADTSMTYMQPS